MDPLIALQVYNTQFPLILSLPDELLLSILDFLHDDAVSAHCLRLVSRRFLYLPHRQSNFWKSMWYWRAPPVLIGDLLFLRGDLMTRFRQLLQRDGRCEMCRRWNESKGPSIDDCKFQCRAHRASYIPQDGRYCHLCQTAHHIDRFPAISQQWSQPYRECLGQQGAVQLCEHVQIKWADITMHINTWRQEQSRFEGWQACLDSFIIECQDASHDTRCTGTELCTWPRARFEVALARPNIVNLNLSWAPHYRMKAEALTTDGRIPAPELRAMFKSLRDSGPADILCPPSRPNSLPEMAFFGSKSRFGPFVYYKTSEHDVPSQNTEPFISLSSDPQVPWWYGCGRDGNYLKIRSHYPNDAIKAGIVSQCLKIRYETDIKICDAEALTNQGVKLVPSHDWLHAMDPRTYPDPEFSHIRPQCTDVDCVNFYLKRKKCYHRSD